MPEHYDARVGGPAPRPDRSRDYQPRRARSRRAERPDRRRGAERPERRNSGTRARHETPRPGPRARPRRGRGPSDRLGIGAIVLSTAVGLSLLGIAERALLEGGPIGGSSGPIGSQRAITPPKKGGVPGQPSGQSPRPGQSGGPAAPDGPSLRTLAAQVRRLTLAQRGAAARQLYGAAPSKDPVVGATRTSDDKTWVFGTTAIPVPASSAANPEVAFYAARWTGREWQVGLSGGRLFGDLLGAVPTSVMPAAEARALRRYATVAEGRAASLVNGTRAGDRLMLPWKIGEAWSMTTTDGSARPLATLAFSGGDGRVLASGDGHLYRFCADSAGRAMIVVIHPSGVATTYHRVRDVPAKVRDGAVVERGDPLGRTGTDRPCGGAAAPRAEVAFGVRRGGGTIPLEGARIGGWTFRERAKPLVGFAERGVLQVLPGGLLANLGPVPAADDPPPSSPPPGIPPVDGAGPVAAPAAVIQKRSPIGANPQQ
ncbi:M23 family metallopeptidase [Spirillospora sp. NBC_00431]